MIPPPPSSTLHSILDIYQACQARGEYAKVILETKRGKTMVNFCSCEEGFPTTPARRAGQLAKKRNSPSDVRRSQRRRAAWRAARAAAEPAVSTPAHCSRTQPYTTVTIFPCQLSLSWMETYQRLRQICFLVEKPQSSCSLAVQPARKN